MRISTITNWAYGVTLLLTGLSAAAFLTAARAAAGERQAVEQHLAFDALANDLEVGTEQLSDAARLFAVRGERRHLDAYNREAHDVRRRDRAIEGVRAQGAMPAELEAINAAEINLSELDQFERSAVALAGRGDRASAQQLLYSPDYERAEAVALASLERFRGLVSTRTQAGMAIAKLESDRASLGAKISLGLTALVFLSVLYFVLRRRVALPLKRMTGIVMRLAKQDYAVDVPIDRRRDEIGDMTQAIHVFRENGIARDRLEAEQRAEQRVKDSILQMMHRLQACQTLSELSEVVTRFAPQTFPELAGRLYVYEERRNALELVASWLEPAHSGVAFPPNACWGFRRGHAHASNGAGRDICCPHINDSAAASLCVPLTAQGDAVGLLYFERRAGADESEQDNARLYLELMSENIALALANLRLRERLAKLASQDGLTGLLNRRALDAALAHQRQDQQIACIMVDIDHFKRFNDEFGHDAGDAVMQHVANLMRQVVGDGGQAYRFGGEEFTLLVAGADQAAAYALAETLRREVAAAPLAHHGRMLGRVSISLGLAVAPDDCPVPMLLRRADAALLDAKSGGRNRTVVASGLAAANDAGATPATLRHRG